MRDLVPLFWEIFQVKQRLDRTRPAGILDNHILSCHRCAKRGSPCEHRFGHRALASLTPEDGLRYVKARMEEGAQAGTIRREWQVFMRLLNVAVRYEKIDRNPLKHVDLPEAHKRTRVAEAEAGHPSHDQRQGSFKAGVSTRALANHSGRAERGIARGKDPRD